MLACMPSWGLADHRFFCLIYCYLLCHRKVGGCRYQCSSCLSTCKYPLPPAPCTQTPGPPNDLVAAEARPGPSAVSAACCKLCAAGGVRVRVAGCCGPITNIVPVSVADSPSLLFCSIYSDRSRSDTTVQRVCTSTAELTLESKCWSAHTILAAAAAVLTGTWAHREP